MPPTFKVVVAMCTLDGVLSDRCPEGILICEGAIPASKDSSAGCFRRSEGVRSTVGAGCSIPSRNTLK